MLQWNNTRMEIVIFGQQINNQSAFLHENSILGLPSRAAPSLLSEK